MYIQSGHYIRCDFCIQVGSGLLSVDDASTLERAVKLRKHLAHLGWARRKAGLNNRWHDFCPDCAEKLGPKDDI